MWKKIILISLLLILLFLLILIGSTYYLLGTEKGFAWTTQQFQNFDDRLSVAPSNGSLQEGIGTESIVWDDEQLGIELSGVQSKWSTGCLLKSTFCLEYLTVEELTVETRSTAENSATDIEPIKLPDLILPLKIEAEEVHIETLRLVNPANGTTTEINDIRLTANASGSEVDINSLSLLHKNYSLLLSGEVELKDDYPINAKLTVLARDVVDTHDFEVDVTLSNTLANLRVNAGLSGGLNMAANADIQTLQPKIPLRANITWQEVGWPLEDFETVTSRDGRLMVVGNLDNYEIRLSSEIDGKDVPQSEFKLKGQVNTERAILPEIDVFLLDGVATASVAASWNNGTHWVADAVFRRLNPGRQWPEMNGTLNGLVQVRGSADEGSWAMTVDQAKVTGELRGFPLDLKAEAARSRDGTWIVPMLHLDNDRNRLALTGSAGETLDLDLELDFQSIQNLVPDIAGNIKGEAQIRGKPDAPSLVLNANTSLLKAGEMLFQDLQLRADVKDAGYTDSNIDLGIGRLTSNAQQINNITAKLTGSRDDHSLSLQLQGPMDTSLQLSTTGNLPDTPGTNSPSGDWLGKLQAVTLGLPEHSMQLANPAALVWQQASKQITVGPHCWAESGASLCLEDPVSSNKQGQANIKLAGYQLRKLNPFLGEKTGLEGVLSAASTLNWNNDQEDGFAVELTADVSDGAVVVDTGAGANQPDMRLAYQSLTLKAIADPYTVVTDVNLKSTEIGNANIALTLNPKHEDKTILGTVSLKGLDVKIAKPFLQTFDEVDGRIDVNGDIGGSLIDPLFTGTVSLKKPLLKSKELPLGVEGGELTARMSGNTADIEGVLQTTGNGTLIVGGNARWQREKWKADLTVDGENLSIRQDPLVSSTINPSLRLALTPDSVSVTGDIAIPEAEIVVKEQSTAVASLSEDVIVIEDEEAKAKAEEEAEKNSTAGPDISTNVTINLGENINLSGYGLTSRLTGDIRFKKENADPPQLGGEIRIVEGFYKSYGQDLEIKDGQILFIGPIEQTTLNIDAVREIDGEERVAGLHVEGPIANPEVTLFTDPADKTQESILSYIVLGRDLGDSQSTEESTLLAQAALALTIRQGRGFATGFAESLGISDFQIDAAGSGDDTQVVVSGRLSRKLLLRYGRSVFKPDQTLFLRYDISKRLYLEAAQGVERAVDVFYSFSF